MLSSLKGPTETFSDSCAGPRQCLVWSVPCQLALSNCRGQCPDNSQKRVQLELPAPQGWAVDVSTGELRVRESLYGGITKELWGFRVNVIHSLLLDLNNFPHS